MGANKLHALVFSMFGVMFMTQASHAQTSFDPTSWREPMEYSSSSDRRLEMVRDVMVRLPSGMAQPEVQEMLGDPDERFASEWVYYLGAGSLSPESQLLVVIFEPNGTVATAQEVRGEAYIAPKSPS